MRCRPVVNYALIAINVVIFVIGYNLENRLSAGYARLYSAELLLNPEAPQLYQFFTSMFLHADIMHLGGNMLFLWVFGNAINDRLGHVGYGAFYLAGGVLAGLGHMMFSNAHVLGASGAISAVTGAYLVLFPMVRLTMVLWFYLITTFHISSIYFLLFSFAKDAYMSFNGTDNVAYAAHLSGYIFGIGVATILLATRILQRDSFDLLNLIRSAHRRGRYRRMAAQGYDPFSQLGATGAPGSKQWVKKRNIAPPVLSDAETRELELRTEISEACKAHNLDTAVLKYLDLLAINSDATLTRQEQLDVSNQLMHSGRHAEAAAAYERFCKYNGSYERMGEIYLLLGLLYGRYLNQKDRGVEMLERAIARLNDPQQAELGRSELAKLKNESQQGS
jgi:membrane associated rhomboid family serine protease